ncbi:hypothetical protein Xaut_3809 [Xanthobacter versatilis]|uniref:Peptide O-xylosyltransferase n=1 Tax=Xanthobacter autotrophicus (strain ATCC BAA-1158 / Py2) TaxID=78245 RepID=A7ILZ1_XANP2|nr:hypothetical protein Xaut_3809 [Xanthobacter autotrophicus Py2]
MPKIAIVCLAYMKTASGVALLADYFKDIAHIYVHVDSKSDATPYKEISALHPNLTLSKERFPIFWGGFNTVRACVKTIEQAQENEEYDRFLFITEDTIPIINRTRFLESMQSEIEWIQTGPTHNPDRLKRYNGFYFYDSYSTTPRPCRVTERDWSPEMSRSILQMEKLRRAGKTNIETLYAGGTWWGLSRPSIEKFISSYNTNIHLRHSFEFSAIPEEHYIHTVLGKIENPKPLVYTDWSRNPTPYIFKTEDELRSIDANGAPMLRKVTVGAPQIENFVRSLMD